MIAFEDMMRKKIVMPAHLIREPGNSDTGDLFEHFSDAAQRINVYTTQDYIDILSNLLSKWKIGELGGLNDAGNKARDYLMALPGRLQRISERVKIPQKQYEFRWIGQLD